MCVCACVCVYRRYTKGIGWMMAFNHTSYLIQHGMLTFEFSFGIPSLLLPYLLCTLYINYMYQYLNEHADYKRGVPWALEAEMIKYGRVQ